MTAQEGRGAGGGEGGGGDREREHYQIHLGWGEAKDEIVQHTRRQAQKQITPALSMDGCFRITVLKPKP
jgi:hypothetical protein